MKVIGGDIGGTKTVLGLFTVDGAVLRLDAEQSFPSARYGSLEAIVAAFMGTIDDPPHAAAFGIAGPVEGNRARTTNLPWEVDGARLARAAALPAVGLLNDLEATALGIFELDAGDLLTLHPGADGATGNAAVIAAGTGLGEAGIVFTDGRPRPFASEGGHGGLAPETALERRLLEFLAGRYERVSWERALSGPGLVAVLEFIMADRGARPSAAAQAALVARDPAAVSRGADDHGCALCQGALDLFVRLYGSEAGNLALKTMARGGVYVGGGIAPKVLRHLQGPGFMAGFLHKGRMAGLLAGIPVRVILNPRAALLGAARRAAGTHGYG